MFLLLSTRPPPPQIRDTARETSTYTTFVALFIYQLHVSRREQDEEEDEEEQEEKYVAVLLKLYTTLQAPSVLLVPVFVYSPQARERERHGFTRKLLRIGSRAPSFLNAHQRWRVN